MRALLADSNRREQGFAAVRALRGSSGLGDALALAVLALDRATKVWARTWLAVHGPIRLLPYFWLSYVENTGAAFGMGRGSRGSNGFFIALALVLSAALITWRRRLPKKQRLTHIALSLVLAGALGNLYDRVVYGWVIDMFDFRVFPVFNVADSSITVGACLLALTMWLEDRRGVVR
jgi:signal peptidase II